MTGNDSISVLDFENPRTGALVWELTVQAWPSRTVQRVNDDFIEMRNVAGLGCFRPLL